MSSALTAARLLAQSPRAELKVGGLQEGRLSSWAQNSRQESAWLVTSLWGGVLLSAFSGEQSRGRRCAIPEFLHDAVLGGVVEAPGVEVFPAFRGSLAGWRNQPFSEPGSSPLRVAVRKRM